VDYDVCLSFAGEDRAYVDSVASALRRRGVTVFYDDYERVSLWGKDLYSHLDHVYRTAARYCIVFVSKHYREKLWTNHERISAQARAFEESSEYLLPVRFDDTEIPGLRPTIGYLDLTTMSPTDLADLICQKLEVLITSGATDTPAVTWSNPIELVTAGTRQRMLTYQCLPLAGRLPDLSSLVGRLVTEIYRRASTSGDDISWTYGQDRYFDQVYATSSVLTALSQLGADPDSTLMRRGAGFLSRTRPASIDDRAATIYLLISGQLTEDDTLAFLATLAGHQIRDATSDMHGSFLLAQGPSAGQLQARQNWSAAPVHSDGASFHACHLADVLLHIPPEHDQARAAAEPILSGLRGFLTRSLSAHGGWLVDIHGNRTPLTVYAMALCPQLSIPLPKEWRTTAAESAMLIEGGEYGLLTTCFGVMNTAFLYSTTLDDDFRGPAVQFVRAAVDRLSARDDLAVLNARDLAAIQRAVAYGVRLIDERLSASVVQATRERMRELDLEWEPG
jgi:hypothetical protein